MSICPPGYGIFLMILTLPTLPILTKKDKLIGFLSEGKPAWPRCHDTCVIMYLALLMIPGVNKGITYISNPYYIFVFVNTFVNHTIRTFIGYDKAPLYMSV